MTNCEQILMGGGKPQTSKVRDERIDSVKYWLIVLVIAGHVFMEFSGKYECDIVWEWIYIFHMPLFVFLSGYFSRKKYEMELLLSIWKLVEPLIIFQTIAIIPKLFSNVSISIMDILTPRWVLWYLLSLVFWRIILQTIPNKFLKQSIIILPITFCISIISGFLPFDRFLSIQRTLSFLPFFFLGYFMKGRNLFLPSKYKLLCAFFLLSTIILPIFFPQWLGKLTHADPYDNYFGALQRIFVFLISLPMSLAFINICVNKSWIAKQGRLTMQYYIYHAFTIPPLMIIAEKLDIQLQFITAIVYSFIITIGIGLILHFPIFRRLTNPSSLFTSINKI